jgi:hypothetical protein
LSENGTTGLLKKRFLKYKKLQGEWLKEDLKSAEDNLIDRFVDAKNDEIEGWVPYERSVNEMLPTEEDMEDEFRRRHKNKWDDFGLFWDTISTKTFKYWRLSPMGPGYQSKRSRFHRPRFFFQLPEYKGRVKKEWEEQEENEETKLWLDFREQGWPRRPYPFAIRRTRRFKWMRHRLMLESSIHNL